MIVRILLHSVHLDVLPRLVGLIGRMFVTNVGMPFSYPPYSFSPLLDSVLSTSYRTLASSDVQ